jgi:hypothetical protein
VFLVKQPCECEPSFLPPSTLLLVVFGNLPSQCSKEFWLLYILIIRRERERERHWFCMGESKRCTFGAKGFLPQRV